MKAKTAQKTKNSKENAEKYKPSEVEKKWQKIWDNAKVYSPNLDNPNESSESSTKGPFYNLMMFPYPSAEGMHVGNMYAFTGSDIYGRFKRMQGYAVFEPMGLDGFGIHSENYALKVNKHPKEQAKISQENFYRQLKSIGNGFDWTRTLETYDPDYYKWTQWIFIQLFKAGLAYRKKAPVNFCPSDKTVLADEQVVDGKCERCGSVVEKRDLEQWFFKITSYADRLLENITTLNWSEKVKIAQKNWIGKKTGINITYKVKDSTEEVVCFTTRPDTNFGATFIVVGPEHPLISKITKSEYSDEVTKYVAWATSQSDYDRMEQGRKKTGVFTGSYAINNLTGKEIPIWISDFVLGNVGTGAVVGVPGHDIRDFEFATQFKLPIIRVVVGSDGDTSEITKPEQVQEENGTMINSEFLNGLDIHVATQKIMDYLEEKGWGKRVNSYHLRDWLISRQRYWGPPIPMIYCSKCDWQPVPDSDLPVLLPDVEDWKPKGSGESPLAAIEEFVNTKCPNCGGPAKRETDVSDTFLDSSWYFFRYISTEIKDNAWDEKRVKSWLPVHMYIGGAEHSVLHLLYSRFLTMVFKDLGYINFEEPFATFRAHGLLIKEGAKMSKSKGNVVIPDEYINKFGADTLRSYLMFSGPFSQGGDFHDTGIEGMYRFLKRVWTLVQEVSSIKYQVSGKDEKGNRELDRKMHKTIKKVTEEIENLRYNTAIAQIMEYYNMLFDFYTQYKILDTKYCKTLVLLLAPFAPHMTEELFQNVISNKVRDFEEISPASNADRNDKSFDSLHLQQWPTYDEKYLREDEVTIVVQVNGKIRDTFKSKNTDVTSQKMVEEMARESEKIKPYLDGKKVVKVVYIAGKIINFVVSETSK